jgi:hypothetical protein
MAVRQLKALVMPAIFLRVRLGCCCEATVAQPAGPLKDAADLTGAPNLPLCTLWENATV